MTAIEGNNMEGVSATAPWTLHDRGTEAKRSDDVIRDPWAVTLLDTISYAHLKFGKPDQSHGLWWSAGWKPLDHIGFVRRNRPSMTLLEFA
jgi:O-methyltransferase involved in polyketide biosynthesis